MHIRLSLAFFLTLGVLQAQEDTRPAPRRPRPAARQEAQFIFDARLLLNTGEVLDVRIRPRAPGTSTIQMERKDREGIISQSLHEVQRMHFNLEDLNPSAVMQLYYSANYDGVIEALRGRINPYFAFADMDANSNELVKIFIRSLYHSGNYPIVRIAAQEVSRYTHTGEVKQTADVFATLSKIKEGDLEDIQDDLDALPEVDLLSPFAPAIWYAQAQVALSSNDWKAAYPPLARIVTESPMEIEWVGEALYLTAQYHHSRTNLVVANQICQELMIVVPGSSWADMAEARMINLAEDAETHEIELTEFGAFRDRERQVDDAAIDYRARQRALREEAARQRREELQSN